VQGSRRKKKKKTCYAGEKRGRYPSNLRGSRGHIAYPEGGFSPKRGSYPPGLRTRNAPDALRKEGNIFPVSEKKPTLSEKGDWVGLAR